MLDDSKITKSSLPWQSFGDETIIIDPENQNSFELNEVGTFIWGCLDGTQNHQQILTALVENFDAPESQLADDLAEFLQNLVASNLIKVGDQ